MRVRGEVLKNENKEKLLDLILLVSAILLCRQGIASRKLPTDWLNLNRQENVQMEEASVSEPPEINMEDGQSEILSSDSRDKKPEQSNPTGNRYFDEVEEYRSILAEHEYAVKSNIETYESGSWENVEDLMFYAGKNNGVLYYCLKDLSGDAHPELIIGTFWENEKIYHPGVIYHYSEEKGIVWSFLSEGMAAYIYDGGIIEMVGPGANNPRLYYRFCPNDSGAVEYLGCYTIEQQDNGTIKYFIETIQHEGGVSQRQLSEKEYKEAIDTYTAALTELQYLPIEGFYKSSVQ